MKNFLRLLFEILLSDVFVFNLKLQGLKNVESGPFQNVISVSVDDIYDIVQSVSSISFTMKITADFNRSAPVISDSTNGLYQISANDAALQQKQLLGSCSNIFQTVTVVVNQTLLQSIQLLTFFF